MQVPLVEPGTEPSPALEPALAPPGATGPRHNKRWLVLIIAIVLCTLAASLWLTRTQESAGLQQPHNPFPY